LRTKGSGERLSRLALAALSPPPLEAILEAQGCLDAHQRRFILLVTVLVALIESCDRLQ
jgi:hypothetical protein